MTEKPIRERLACIEANTENLTKQVDKLDTKIDGLDKKFDRFVERHDEKCPGRFSLLGVVALVAALIAILKSFLGKG